MKRKCITCETEYESETEDGLREFFYFKSGYLRRTCKKCELKDHKEKYQSGKYNYSNDSGGYEPSYTIGNFNRCYHVSQYDNHPCFGRKFNI